MAESVALPDKPAVAPTNESVITFENPYRKNRPVYEKSSVKALRSKAFSPSPWLKPNPRSDSTKHRSLN